MDKKKLILFDIDYTLYDASAYKSKMFNSMAEKLRYYDKALFILGAQDVYSQMREKGPIDLDLFADGLINKFSLRVQPQFLIDCMFGEDVLSVSLYKEAHEVIPLIHKKEDYILGVFSAGVTLHQHAKIEKLKEFFNWEYVHVFPINKKLHLPKVLKKYTDYEIYIVDDLLDVLSTAKNLNPKVTTIWSKRGLHKNDIDLLSTFTPDYTIENLRELLNIIV